MSRGVLVVVSGFSGAGKGTIMKSLMAKYDNYALSISMTTRQPREGEEDGREYFFRTREQFEENIANTKKVVELAKQYEATVEAELGLVGGSEDGSCDHGIRCTDPDGAKVFAKETGIDALAVAIGNAHGNYPVAPTLAFDVLEKIHENVDIPLVLHGGSGITDKDFQKAISLGIRKVNIATASFNSLTKKVEEYIDSNEKHNYFDLNTAMTEGTYENVKRHIQVFNTPFQQE